MTKQQAFVHLRFYLALEKLILSTSNVNNLEAHDVVTGDGFCVGIYIRAYQNTVLLLIKVLWVGTYHHQPSMG